MLEILADVAWNLLYLSVGIVAGAASEHLTHWWSRLVLPALRRLIEPE